ncbi:hypothetical protein E2C01_049933 [Portunus trituberculatus]|uniref:Uncharacterized protein n=1 Tax=Portunus trituberculatus TaxID=210409 RepID=A0A5B7GHG1_PORTR|nr:hypothetical protein [Portunus trituberculatus]
MGQIITASSIASRDTTTIIAGTPNTPDPNKHLGGSSSSSTYTSGKDNNFTLHRDIPCIVSPCDSPMISQAAARQSIGPVPARCLKNVVRGKELYPVSLPVLPKYWSSWNIDEVTRPRAEQVQLPETKQLISRARRPRNPARVRRTHTRREQTVRDSRLFRGPLGAKSATIMRYDLQQNMSSKNRLLKTRIRNTAVLPLDSRHQGHASCPISGYR